MWHLAKHAAWCMHVCSVWFVPGCAMISGFSHVCHLLYPPVASWLAGWDGARWIFMFAWKSGCLLVWHGSGWGFVFDTELFCSHHLQDAQNWNTTTINQGLCSSKFKFLKSTTIESTALATVLTLCDAGATDHGKHSTKGWSKWFLATSNCHSSTMSSDSNRCLHAAGHASWQKQWAQQQIKDFILTKKKNHIISGHDDDSQEQAAIWAAAAAAAAACCYTAMQCSKQWQRPQQQHCYNSNHPPTVMATTWARNPTRRQPVGCRSDGQPWVTWSATNSHPCAPCDCLF